MFCRNCGAEIPEGGSFCGSCGTPVKEEPVGVREPEGSRPVMEDREKEKKTDASSGARENNPDMEMQSKGGKPLIIGVCSGALLLAVGIAILFTTGVPGGKDKPKEAIAEADEPKKVADSAEQQKEEMEEKPDRGEPMEEEAEEESDEEEPIEEEPDEEEPEQDVNEEKEDTADLAAEDYLCSDSSTRILTQEDVEKLQSGTYEDLPEGKGIIQMAVNEMYARRGYQFGSQSIQDYFETKGWYREIEGRSDDQESIYQNMSDIEQANVQFLSSFSEDLQGDVDVEAEVAQIREWFYDTQERQDSLMCCEYTQGTYYFEYGYAIKGVIPADYDDWGYTREYYYHDRKLYFAFLFAGSEEYRLYFKDGKVIRYIDANGTVYDYGDIGEGEQLGERVRLESDALYPGVNCGL